MLNLKDDSEVGVRIGTRSPTDVLAAYGFQQSSRSSSSTMDSQSKRDLIARSKKLKGDSSGGKKGETFAEVLEHLSKR